MWCRGVALTAAILSGVVAAPPAASATPAPGGSTGWHWHTGQLYGAINEGTLTHYAGDCSVDGVYPAGAGVFEPSGADHVHIGRNLGDVPLVMHVLYVLPAGSALSEDAPDP